MLETSDIPWRALAIASGLLVAGCVASPPQGEPQLATPANEAATVERSPAASAESRLAQEAKALLAQAETDVQRARAKRALWQKAWEALLASRQAVAANDSANAIRQARRASELAQLGLEQLAYPAVK